MPDKTLETYIKLLFYFLVFVLFGLESKEAFLLYDGEKFLKLILTRWLEDASLFSLNFSLEKLVFLCCFGSNNFFNRRSLIFFSSCFYNLIFYSEGIDFLLSKSI